MKQVVVQRWAVWALIAAVVLAVLGYASTLLVISNRDIDVTAHPFVVVTAPKVEHGTTLHALPPEPTFPETPKNLKLKPPPLPNTGGMQPGSPGYYGPFTLAHHVGWPYPPWSVNWDDIAYCESTWRWHINTGNGFYGGLQFTLSTWQWYGGGRFAYWPQNATPYEQKIVAERVLTGWDGHNRPGQGIGAWPVCGRLG